MARILITGGCGYIGSHICLTLLEQDHELIVFDNFSTSSPLAIKRVRYAGEWVCAVVANSRAVAEDALEKISLELIKQEFVLDAEEALSDKSPNVHPEHGSNILLEKKFIWGEVEKDFDKSDHILNYTVKWYLENKTYFKALKKSDSIKRFGEK